MNLKEAILNCNNYEDTDEHFHMIFAKKNHGGFEPNSEVIVLKLSQEEAEMDLDDISKAKCPGFDYFLEPFIVQEFLEDLKHQDEYRTDDEKVKRVIYYAEFDA